MGRNIGKNGIIISVNTSKMSSRVPIPKVSCPNLVLSRPNLARIGRRTASPTVAKERATTTATNGELPMCVGNRKKRSAPTMVASRPIIRMAPLRICFPKRFIWLISRLKPIMKSKNSIPIVESTLKVSSCIVV